MEEANMMPQAANLYYTALVKKPTNVEAMVGLKRTGQIVLSQHISSFDEAVAFGNEETAIDAWHEAEEWDKKLDAVGVELAFPEGKRSAYNSVKNAHLNETYAKATSLLEQEKFEEALVELDAILALDNAYEDAQRLKNIAFCEPRYRRGVLAEESDLYRSALKEFSELLEQDGTYKDAASKRNDVLEAGRFTVALMEFKNGTTQPNVEVKLQALVEQALMGSKDPFLKVVDRESLSMVLQEQSMGMNGLTTGGDVEIGNLLGAKALLKATITTCDYRKSQVQMSTKTGYEKYRIERVNEEGKKYYETKYRPVQYREFAQDASLEFVCTYKFISTVTGEVVSTNAVEGRATDNIRYIQYNGDKGKFFLGGNSGARTNGAARGERDRLMSSRTTLQSLDALADEVGQDLAEDIQRDIERQLLEMIR
jgi:hypothetical protein